MADISRILFTAKQSVMSHLTAIDATGSNISNVNTAGYSRLVPVFESVGTKDVFSENTQIGVKIGEVQRIYDKFLVSQLVLQESQVGDYQAQKDLLTRIESILNENTGGGVNDALNQFWSAWGDISANPAGETQRNSLVIAAENLSAMFRQRATDLTTLQAEANQGIADTVTVLNGYLQDMSAYNDGIVKILSSGGNAPDLLDKRDELLRKISSLVDVNYLEKTDGSLYVYLSNGSALVEDTNVFSLDVAQLNPNDSSLYDVVFAENPEKSLDEYITTGKLSGLLAVRDTAIPEYIDALNQTATSIINKVNEQHSAGYDRDGNFGDAFFTEGVTEARYMRVSEDILNDNAKIAASATVNGDGDNASAMVALQNDNMYASMGQISTSGSGSVTGEINNIGQAYKNTTSAITLTRGATSDHADWTISNGGYTALQVISADDESVTIDLNGNGTADITLNLSGTWAVGNTISFRLTKSDNTTSIGGYYDTFIAKMGQDVASSSLSFDRQTTIINQFGEQREAFSGVSLDEEMMNLIKYQMGYNAAGRLITTVSEMMDTLMNMAI